MSKPKIKVHEINLNDLADGDESAVQGLVDMIGDELPDEVKEAIRGVITKAKEDHGVPFKDETEAQAEALTFFGECAPTVGQLVVRNARGMKHYKCPAEKDKGIEAAVVVDVWPHYKFHPKTGRLVNGVIAVATGKGGVHMHSVDLRMYEVATVTKN